MHPPERARPLTTTMPQTADLLGLRAGARHTTASDTPTLNRASAVNDADLAAHLEYTRRQFSALRQEIAEAFARAQEQITRQFAAARAELDATLADARTRRPPTSRDRPQ